MSTLPAGDYNITVVAVNEGGMSSLGKVQNFTVEETTLNTDLSIPGYTLGWLSAAEIIGSLYLFMHINRNKKKDKKSILNPI